MPARKRTGRQIAGWQISGRRGFGEGFSRYEAGGHSGHSQQQVLPAKGSREKPGPLENLGTGHRQRDKSQPRIFGGGGTSRPDARDKKGKSKGP